MSVFRFFAISRVVFRYGLSELFAKLSRSRPLRLWFSLMPTPRPMRGVPLPQRARMALVALGPLWVKFGQVLSTRPDLMPAPYAEELAKLQDRVPPFSGELAVKIIEEEFRMPISEAFEAFDPIPVASASVAQVHRATLTVDPLKGPEPVAVKVLRPGIEKAIAKDLALMRFVAGWVGKLSVDGRRLKPKEVVKEFEKHLSAEVDLRNEAANCSQFCRQFEGSDKLIVPKVYFSRSSRRVFTMEWMNGVPISEIETLKAKGIDLAKLGRYGVEIFFTQVFKYGFFHADMHPGNIFVSDDNRYITLDFGIVGALTEFDKRYLAINMLAFFNRDYKRVATAHVESGWVPPDTSVEELESAVRSVCEPMFNKPLRDISLGLVLMRLFDTSRRFRVEIQPQLILLQKTMLNVEGLGRQLDPNLDLWKTAKPFLNRWMSEEVGWLSLRDNIKKEAVNWSRLMPALPRRVDDFLRAAALRDAQWQDRAMRLDRLLKLAVLLVGALSASAVALVVLQIAMLLK